MATFEKGLSYNFIIERIAEAKGNYYYVIQVEHKECWIKMYPFEIYQGSKKNIIRCEYRGRDSFGSHIFIEDKLSILYELYEENKEYEFSYVKESVDANGKLFSVLSDRYGLLHRLYEPLVPEYKDVKRSLKCIVTSFNQTSKALTLHLISGSNRPILNSINKNSTAMQWMDAKTLFNTIGEEHMLNELFYAIKNSDIYNKGKDNFIKLYEEQDKKWIKAYIKYLNNWYKKKLVQSGQLEKLSELADFMIKLTGKFVAEKEKKMPKPYKYEGLKKAINILQTGSLEDYHKKLNVSEEVLSEMSILFGLFEVDRDFFGEHFLFYKESTQMLYDNIKQMDTSSEFHRSRQKKCLKAFRRILSQKLKMEQKRFIEDILDIDPFINSYTFKQLYDLLKHSNHIDLQAVHSYMDRQPTILGELVCLIYGSKLIRNTEDAGRLLTCINNINYISTLCEEFEEEKTEEKDVVEIEEEEETLIDETNVFLNVYNDRTYIISENQIDENNIIKRIAINPQKDKFILQCYEHGSVNKVAVRYLLEKKRGKRYLNGLYPQDQLKEIFVSNDEAYLAVISSYDQETFVKLYSTKYISEHSSLGLKGNQVVGANVDSTEYFLVASEYSDLLPQRLIYDSVTPIGKNVKNSYYENDIQTLKRLGIVGF